MIKRTCLIFTFFSFFLFNFLSAQLLQFENQVIEKIDIAIHTSAGEICDNNAILARMATKQGGVFSQIQFDEDLKALSLDFDRVEPVVETMDEKVFITLNIWPKPVIRSIKWVGNHKVESKRLQRELAIYPLSVFERQAFNTAFHKLKAYYIRKGFFEAQLDYHVHLDAGTNQVDITIHIHEGRSGHIEEIVFVNFTDCEEQEILDQMITKKYNLFTSWITQAGTYNEDAIQQDRLIIINYLQNQGYADAQVKMEVVESETTNRIIVNIIADKGERYYFNQISFEGNTIICDEEIDLLFSVRPNTPYSMEALRETVEAITEAYGRLGYIDAVVDFDTELVEGTCTYDAKFTIEEGEQFRVGMIRVFGNVSTKTSVILHETLLIPGEVFNTYKLKRTELRLRNIGYFKNVNVYAVKASEGCSIGSNYRDVYIEVEETTTGQFGAFLGYSSTEELFGGINITERNFNHEGFYYFWRDSLKAFRGGGEYAHFTATIGQKSRSYVLSWTKPYFMDTKWTVGADLSNTSTRYISKEYDLETVSLNLRAQYSINQYLRFGLHYRLKNGVVHLHNMKEEERKHREAAHELEEEARIHGLISAVGTTLVYDSTNHPIKPTEGFRSRLMLEYAGVGGDHTFFNISYLNSYYYPVGSRTVIKYRADFRFIQPVGDTSYETMPLDERVFLGGEYTVRGYRPYRLGPQYPGTHIPRGGLSLQLYSVEISRRLFCNFDTFIFFDAGQLSRDTWEFGHLSASLGYGARFKLIPSLPEVSMGMGYPLNPRNRSEVKKFFISFGGSF
jgi:outer membrane protein insertion porin family